MVIDTFEDFIANSCRRPIKKDSSAAFAEEYPTKKGKLCFAKSYMYSQFITAYSSPQCTIFLPEIDETTTIRPFIFSRFGNKLVANWM